MLPYSNGVCVQNFKAGDVSLNPGLFQKPTPESSKKHALYTAVAIYIGLPIKARQEPSFSLFRQAEKYFSNMNIT